MSIHGRQRGGKFGGDPPWVNTLRSDLTTIVPPTGVTKPTYLGNITDANFGTKIVRITDDPGNVMANVTGGIWGQVPKHHYSLDQSWNSDESVLYLETNRDPTPIIAGDPANPTGRLFLDGQTYAPLSYSGNNGRDFSIQDRRWTPNDPTKMFFVANDTFGLWDPATNLQTVIRTFTGYTNLLFGTFKGFYSANGNTFIFQGTNPTAQACFFAYDVATDTKHPDIVPGVTMSSSQISFDGNFVIATESVVESVHVYDLAGTEVQSWPANGSGAGEPSHFDLTRDQSGDEVAVGVGKINFSGRVVKRRLADGVTTALTTAASGNFSQHVSTRATKFPGWAIVTYGDQQPSFPLYQGEIVAVKLDGSKVCRICHHHALNEVDFYSYPYASVSPSGTRIIFGTSWYDPNANTRPMYGMVVDLR